MTDNEIIKACKDCLHYEACLNLLTKAFPNISQNEIDIVASHEGGCRCFKDNDLINRQKAEIERLNHIVDVNKKAKAEAVKGFAERLKKRYREDEDVDIAAATYKQIDNLVKEFTEEQK